jgi:3-deoxy-D-manno-octulosonic-acid transferase
MYVLYNIALYLGFALLTPRFLYDKLTDGKWAAGFWQRLGNVPALDTAGGKVVLLHCVSVGEANAALPLAKALKRRFPHVSLVVSTTTRTGQQVACDQYAGIADLVVYFPFDLSWSVRRFLRQIKPDLVLLTETELWFNFIRSSHAAGTRTAIINGRLSERSFRRYSLIKTFVRRVLADIDLALMQTQADAERAATLGVDQSKVHAIGNLKFDIEIDAAENDLTRELRARFDIDNAGSLILAASTHEPEERILLDALKTLRTSTSGSLPRMMIAPRHPERFDRVADQVETSGFTFARRSSDPSDVDANVDVILLDSVGELRSAYPLADVVFVGGSLIPHGGQSIFEPAAAGKAIVTGPYTLNFDAAVREFLASDAMIQLPDVSAEGLSQTLKRLLTDTDLRSMLGNNALAVLAANRGAARRTLQYLEPLFASRG